MRSYGRPRKNPTPSREVGFAQKLSGLTDAQLIWFIRRAQEEGLLPLPQVSSAACAHAHQRYGML